MWGVEAEGRDAQRDSVEGRKELQGVRRGPEEAWDGTGTRPPHGRGQGRVWGATSWLSEGASPRVRPRQSGRGALPQQVSAHPCLSFPTLQGL